MSLEQPSALAEGTTLQLKWPLDPDLPITLADQLQIGFRGDYYLLTIGQAEQPMFSGEASMAAVLERGFVGVRPLARFAVPRVQMDAWITAIQSQMAKANEGKTT